MFIAKSPWRFVGNFILNPLKKIHLGLILTVPFALQLLSVVVLIGYLSYSTGQQAVDDLVNQMMGQVSDRVVQHLQTYTRLPLQLATMVAHDLESQRIRLKGRNFAYLDRYFLERVKTFGNISFMYVGNQQGYFIGAGPIQRGEPPSFLIEVNDGTTHGDYVSYGVDAAGRRSHRIHASPHYDARQRPWYKAAIAAGHATWSSVYDFVGEANTGLTISATQPFHAVGGAIAGVAGVDLYLNDISKFLQQLQVSPDSSIFVIDRDGWLIGSSKGEPTSQTVGGETRPVAAIASTNPLIREVAQQLQQREKTQTSPEIVQQPFKFDFTWRGEHRWGRVSPYQDSAGLDWRIVVIVPESDFVQHIRANVHRTALLCGIALLMMLGVGLMATQWVIRPIQQLNQATRSIIEGEWQHPLPCDRADEIGELARSFQKMARQVQTSLTDLRIVNQTLMNYQQSLEEQVNERTTKLQQANQKLIRLALFDGLTQVANRHQFDQTLNKAWRRLMREQQPLSLILCDVDYFKRYNDHYGHQAGDYCLQTIASQMQSVLNRPDDLVARYGGEEFALLLPNTDTEGAKQVACSIQQAIRALKLPHSGSQINPFVTLSAGIATLLPNSLTSPEDLVEQADQALYRAKELGRDRYCHAETLYNLV